MDPEARIAQVMLDLGHEQLVASVEDATDSVWVDDDRVEAPGYYARQRVPLPHTFLRDGRTFVVEFVRRGVTYRLRAGHRESYNANGQRVVELISTLREWIVEGLLTWSEAFGPFVHDAWWIVLRVPADATRDEVDAAYRRQVLLHHPDRGGSADAFRKVHAAYQLALLP